MLNKQSMKHDMDIEKPLISTADTKTQGGPITLNNPPCFYPMEFPNINFIVNQYITTYLYLLMGLYCQCKNIFYTQQ